MGRIRPTIGYHASHEQFLPSTLLALVVAAEAAGFSASISSDHFAPWSESQGQSGYAWSWLGAALQATRLPFGVVTAPGYRYHPAIVAQASATLGEMFPGRFWIALGSGQLMNEGITGTHWPPKAERNARLEECAGIIRRLWAGETVTHHGLVTVEEARLYTLPSEPPLMLGAAISSETAEWVGAWADGLITTSRPPEELRDVVNAFRRGGGGGKPMYLKVDVSYAPDEDEARHMAWEQWRFNLFENSVATSLRLPGMFDAASVYIRPEDMDEGVRISADPDDHIAWLRDDASLGFERLFVHNVNTNQRQFIEFYGKEVLPSFSREEALHGQTIQADL